MWNACLQPPTNVYRIRIFSVVDPKILFFLPLNCFTEMLHKYWPVLWFPFVIQCTNNCAGRTLINWNEQKMWKNSNKNKIQWMLLSVWCYCCSGGGENLQGIYLFSCSFHNLFNILWLVFHKTNVLHKFIWQQQKRQMSYV